MIKKIPLLVIFSMMLLSAPGNADIPSKWDEEGRIPMQPIQNSNFPSYSMLERRLFSASSIGNIDSVKEIIEANELPFHVARQGAKNAAEGGHIEIFRMLYLMDSDPHRDNVLIPAIRNNGYLNAFYISLTHNGNIDVLERLMDAGCMLDTVAINAIFDAALTAYREAESISAHDESTTAIYMNFMENMLLKEKTKDKVDLTQQSDYKHFVLKEEMTTRFLANDVIEAENAR